MRSSGGRSTAHGKAGVVARAKRAKVRGHRGADDLARVAVERVVRRPVRLEAEDVRRGA